MRLPIAIAASLLISLGFRLPVMSQVPSQVKQAGRNLVQNTTELKRELNSVNTVPKLFDVITVYSVSK